MTRAKNMIGRPTQPSPLASNPQYLQLRALILERHARCMWQVEGPEMYGASNPDGVARSVIEAWHIPGCIDKNTSIILVHVFPDEWIDLYMNGTPHDWTEIAAWLGPARPPHPAEAAVLAAASRRQGGA